MFSVCEEGDQWHEIQLFPQRFDEWGNSPHPVAGKNQNLRW